MIGSIVSSISCLHILLLVHASMSYSSVISHVQFCSLLVKAFFVCLFFCFVHVLVANTLFLPNLQYNFNFYVKILCPGVHLTFCDSLQRFFFNKEPLFSAYLSL